MSARSGGTEEATPRGPGAFVAFRYRDYTLFWVGGVVSNIGNWLNNLAFPFVLFQLTGSAFWVGLSVVAQYLPGVLAMPWAGMLADRYPRRSVLLWTQSTMAAGAWALFIMWSIGVREPVALLLPATVMGLMNAVNQPSWQSILNDLVPRPALRSAIALNALQVNAARSIGPAIAGVIIASAGVSVAFLINAVSFVAVIGTLLLLRIRESTSLFRSDRGAIRELASAVQYTCARPGLVISIVVAVAIGVLGFPVFSMTVVFAESVYETGAVGLGFLNAALGLGSVAAAPIVAGVGRPVRFSKLVGVGLVAYGLGLLLFGLVPSYVVGVVALVLIGGAFTAVNGSSQASLHHMVHDAWRGRVTAVRIAFVMAAVPTGALLQGAAADSFGVEASMTIAGIALLVVLAVLLLLPKGRGLARIDDPPDE